MNENIMNEDYVSLEVAKLLHEKGYSYGGKIACVVSGKLNIDYIGKDKPPNPMHDMATVLRIHVPTLYMAQKWLRKEKGIYVWVEPVVGQQWTTSSCDFNVCLEESDWINRELHKGGYPVYKSYTEAFNAVMFGTLKLI